MMLSIRRTALLSLAAWWVAVAVECSAQGTRAGYERAAALPDRVRDTVTRSKVEPRWLPGEAAFWYRVDLGDGRREFVLVDAEAGTRTLAFDHAAVATALSRAMGTSVAADRLPIEELRFDPLRLQVRGTWRQFDAAAGNLSDFRLPVEASKPKPQRENRRRSREGDSPDGRFAAFVRGGNLFLRDRDTEAETPLSTDGTDADGFRGDLSWSPDSTRLVAVRRKRADERIIHLIESSPRDRLQPKLHSLGYAKPGDEIDRLSPRLFHVEAKTEIPISQGLFPNPWSIDEVRWSPGSSRFTFAYNERGHQTLRVIGVDAATGAATAIVDETSPTFIDYADKRFAHYVEAAGELIWASERDGWNHLYLYDLKTGAVKNRITQGPWLVRGVDRIDEAARQVWFRAVGIRPEQDPYHVHCCRVNFDGSGLVVLTAGDGTHEVEFSPDGRFLLDAYSRVDLPPVTELRRTADGSLVVELERADWSKLLATGWQVPERFVAKGRDDATDIYGVIYRPTNFDSAKRYPVVEKIYAGPQGAFVPKRFSTWHGDAQAIAELGFVVVQIDGMGTNWRSKAFHDVCWRNLGDSGFPDRIRWLKAAAAAHPELDLSRVGIYGGSAGGQSALRALLAHGDFYKVAAADCGCHDNRMDKIWWNELWMGWPVGPWYAEQSNVTNAPRLTGKLLLIVGELDRNVDPASTMQVVDALVRSDKDFDLLVVPGSGHGAAESPYGRRRRADFLVRHLLGVEPRGQ